MQAFRIHTGLVAPIDRENVDTDAIIPKQFLKSIKKSGFGPNLFDEWRYLDHGEPGQDPATRQPLKRRCRATNGHPRRSAHGGARTGSGGAGPQPPPPAAIACSSPARHTRTTRPSMRRPA